MTMESAIKPPLDGERESYPLEGFVHGYSETNGTRIHYVIGGTGPAVVLLHGFPYSWAVWRRLMPLLAASGYTVLAPDLRGMGFSAPAENDSFSKLNVAEDIHGVVHGLGLGPINLVGMDIGTMVAYAYAARYPDEVRRLIFSESLIPGFGLEELMNPATGGFWHFGFHMQVELATFLTKGKEGALSDAVLQDDVLRTGCRSGRPVGFPTAPHRTEWVAGGVAALRTPP